MAALPSLAIQLGRTKTTSGEEDDVVYLTGRPVEALHNWLKDAKIDKGPVFRGIGRWGTVSKRALDPQSVNAILKLRAKLAGLYQFLSGTARQYGLVDRFNAEASTRAAIKLVFDNAGYLRKVLGKEPAPALLYMAHQQGVGGVAKLLRNPEKKAADLVGKAAVVQNGGQLDWTAREFLEHWIDKFDAVR